MDGVEGRGRTLESARIDLVDQLSRHLGVPPGHMAVIDDVHLAAPAGKALTKARAARNAALEWAAKSNVATTSAVHELTAQGLSLRDCGYLLGLSHGRVSQILEATAGTARKKTQPKKRGK